MKQLFSLIVFLPIGIVAMEQPDRSPITTLEMSLNHLTVYSAVESDKLVGVYGRSIPNNSILLGVLFRFPGENTAPSLSKWLQSLITTDPYAALKRDTPKLVVYDDIKDAKEGDTLTLTMHGVPLTVLCKQCRSGNYESMRTFERVLTSHINLFKRCPDYLSDKRDLDRNMLLEAGIIIGNEDSFRHGPNASPHVKK